MTKQEFLDITRNCFKEYGFMVKKNKLFLDLDDLVIMVILLKSNFGEYYYIDYNIGIKKLHKNIDLISNTNSYDLLVYARFCISPGRLFELEYGKLTDEAYVKDLEKLIDAYFCSFKNLGLKHVKTLIGQPYMIFSEEAKGFLENL